MWRRSINNHKKKAGFLLALASITMLYAFMLPARHLTVYLAGDSTMADKEVKAYPETGWGMPFRTFFDSTVTVINKARNGRSTKSFIAEGLWKSITDNLKEGDYVLIQFGHNDEVTTKVTYTPEAEFKANLIKMIAETRDRKGNPVLITPVTRRKFTADGHVEETHQAYTAIVHTVADEQKVPLIDLDAESQAVIQKFGPENSKLLYNQLLPGEHPNYPAGQIDNTHFNELGARLMAQLVLNDIKTLHLSLADRIVKGKTPATVDPQVK